MMGSTEKSDKILQYLKERFDESENAEDGRGQPAIQDPVNAVATKFKMTPGEAGILLKILHKQRKIGLAVHGQQIPIAARTQADIPMRTQLLQSGPPQTKKMFVPVLKEVPVVVEPPTYEELDDEVRTLRERVTSLDGTIRDLNSQLNRANNTVKREQNKLEQSEQANAGLKNKLKEAKQGKREQQEDFTAKEQALTQRINALQEEVDTLRTQGGHIPPELRERAERFIAVQS